MFEHMAGPLAEMLFVLAAIAIAVAHTLIIRSTIRTLPASGAALTARSRVRELVWALLPALILAALLVWTWRTMHPDSMTFRLPADHAPIGTIST